MFLNYILIPMNATSLRSIFVLLLAFWLLSSVSLHARDAEEEGDRFHRIMENTVLEQGIDLRGLSFSEATTYVEEHLPFSLHIHPQVRDRFEASGEGRDGPDLTVRFQNDIEVSRLLRFLLSRHNLAAQVREGSVEIVTSDQKQKPVLRFYDVRDLTFGRTDFPGPTIELKPPEEASDTSLSEDSLSFGPSDEQLINEESDIIVMLKDHISSQSWQKGGVNIQLRGGYLLISQSPAVHREIRRFLNNLRSFR